MALSEGQVQLRDLVIGPGTPYRFVKGSHFNPFKRDVRADQGGARAWSAGSWSGAEWAEQVAIAMRLVVLARGPAEYVTLMSRLLAAFAPSGGDVDLRFVLAGAEYLMRGRPRMVDPESRHLDGHTYVQAAFVALDPTIYSGTEHEVPLSLPSTVGGLTVPLTTAVLAADAFGRTATDSWGTPDVGPAWTTSGGVAADYQVSGGVGTHRVGAVNASRWSILTGVAAADVEIRGVVSTNALASGGGHFEAVATRFADPNNCYLARLELASNQTVILTLRKRVGGTETQLATHTTGLTHTPGGKYTVVLQTVGPVVRARAWQTSDPNVWHLQTTDTDLTAAGAVAIRSILSSTNTNPLPVTASWDDIQVTTVGGGLTVPVTVAAAVTSGRASITNTGTKPVGLRIRVDGPVVEPRASLLTPDGTGIVRVWTDLTAGQWLDIDTAARTVYLNGTASRRGVTTVTGIGWPVLPPGTHEIAFDASTYSATATATVRWRDTWH
ncbi:phage distal tail protein [Micromonospora inyonensis]|uniref:Phage tail protein n=1 Tax=Micromonospora inyonensis TaxID=47866 RepID=A0A1C6RD17_9ACTN|nr:phage tail domain-containing protein [Micromonospora inyonensis]SCL15045.1 Phage tail protein [Micromonospora inyonensis]